MSKKILVSDGNGKYQEVSENYVSVDVDNGCISASMLAVNTASIPNSLTDKPAIIENGQLKIIPNPTDVNRLIQYRAGEGFSTTSGVTFNLQGDLSGSFPTSQIKVTSVTNVNSGTLSTVYGGAGNNSYADKSIITADGGFSILLDQSTIQNEIILSKGKILNAPVGLFGGNALSSSYDASSSKNTGYIKLSEPYTGDFTAECWTYLTNIGNSIVTSNRSTIFYTNNNFSITVGGAAAGGATGYYSIFNRSTDTQTSLAFVPNQWVHLAMVRNGNNLKIYANGTGSADVAITATQIIDTGLLYVGTSPSGRNYNINGFISELSYIKRAKSEQEIKSYYNSVKAGTFTRYNSAANYTSSLNVYNPSMLAPFTSSATTDISINNNTISLPNGVVATVPAAFPAGLSGTQAISSSYNLTSGKWTSSIQFTQPFTGNFTHEAWVYLSNVGSNTSDNNRSIIFQDNLTRYALIVNGSSANATTGTFGIYNGSTVTNTGISFIPNSWTHVVLVRSGNVYRAIINGVQSSDVTTSFNDTTTTLFVGTNGYTNGQWNTNGFITAVSSVRYAKTAAEVLAYYNAVVGGTQGRLSNTSVTTTYDTGSYIPYVLSDFSQDSSYITNKIIKYNDSNLLSISNKSSTNYAPMSGLTVYLFTGSVTSSNTYSWTKPEDCRFIRVICQGGGGGGAAGSRYLSGQYYGGSGGAGGGFSDVTFNGYFVSSSVIITPGSGGAGGATDTAPGTNGGNSSFGNYISSYGGEGGKNNGTSPNNIITIGGAGLNDTGGAGGGQRTSATNVQGQSTTKAGPGGGFGGEGSTNWWGTAGGGRTDFSIPVNVINQLNGYSYSTAYSEAVIRPLITGANAVTYPFIKFNRYFLNGIFTVGNFPNLLSNGGSGGCVLNYSTNRYRAGDGGNGAWGSGGGGGGTAAGSVVNTGGRGGNGGAGYVLVICY